MHSDQNDAAMVKTAEARLKKVDERHLNFAYRDGFDFHGKALTTKDTKDHEGFSFVSFVVEAFASVHPSLIPLPQQEFSVSRLVMFVAQHGQARGKRLQESLSIALLHLLRAIPGSR